ncbi:MAG: gamma-glutamyl-gamma-aminobutyrate hydrolase family protein [Candidatus Tyrphobacter sp.]
MRSTIGITAPAYQLSGSQTSGSEVQRHIAFLESLGAQSVVLTQGKATSEAVKSHELNGLLFSGGGDVAASLYGGREDLSWDRVDPERDAGELSLLRLAYAEQVPMLCVCRGMQIANVALGGTLIEDIPAELGPRYSISHHQVRDLKRPPREQVHEVHMSEDSQLARIFGDVRVWTNSLHHQAIRALAPPLRGVGYTEDGIIEAVELTYPEFFFYGVQWHPEYLPADEASVRLYAAFLDAAKATIPDSRMHES